MTFPLTDGRGGIIETETIEDIRLARDAAEADRDDLARRLAAYDEGEDG